MDGLQLVAKAKEHLRILENYMIPENIKINKFESFLNVVISFQYEQIKILEARSESIFNLLCNDMIRQAVLFLNDEEKDIREAKNLLNIIISIEDYILEIDKIPWSLGKKISFLERIKIKSIIKKKLHSAYDEKTGRSVRGTKILVKLTGSLARGYSDWKLINGGNIPRPADYNIPKEYRKSQVLKKLDSELNVPLELKAKMSDVDLLIMNEVIFDSINKDYAFKPWSFKLGEKYQTGTGGSNILEKLHQSLVNIKIGGIRNRWVNYVVVRDEEGYKQYMSERFKQIKEVENRCGKEIVVNDVLIFEGIIH